MNRFSKPLLPLVAFSFVLAACSTHISSPQQTIETSDHSQMALLSGAPAPNTGSVAGSNMDELDRSKLYHALDGGLGKATSWDNVATGVEYTVIPTEKVTVNGNSFCRKYSIRSAYKSGSAREMTGTACVSSDGAWHPA